MGPLTGKGALATLLEIAGLAAILSDSRSEWKDLINPYHAVIETGNNEMQYDYATKYAFYLVGMGGTLGLILTGNYLKKKVPPPTTPPYVCVSPPFPI